MIEEDHNRLFSEINDANGVVHDMWFSVDSITLSSSDNILFIPVKNRPKENQTHSLIFNDVSSYRVVDTEKIDCYDINKIQHNTQEGCLEIVGNIPILIQIFFRSKINLKIEKI